MKNRLLLLCLSVFGCLLLANAMTLAQESATLPKADTIMEKMIEAVGGKEAFDKISTMITKSNMEMPAMNMQAKISTYAQKSPTKFYMTGTMEGLGEFSTGYNGEVVWDKNPMMGARIMDGDEAALAKRDAEFDSLVRWKEIYEKVECTGTEKINDKDTYVMEMKLKDGPRMKWFVDQDSYLLNKMEITIDSQMGKIPVVMEFQDYKTVEGIQSAHKVVQTAGPQKVIVTIQEIQYNAEIPAEKFELPEEVQKLVEKKKTN